MVTIAAELRQPLVRAPAQLTSALTCYFISIWFALLLNECKRYNILFVSKYIKTRHLRSSFTAIQTHIFRLVFCHYQQIGSFFCRPNCLVLGFMQVRFTSLPIQLVEWCGNPVIKADKLTNSQLLRKVMNKKSIDWNSSAVQMFDIDIRGDIVRKLWVPIKRKP